MVVVGESFGANWYVRPARGEYGLETGENYNNALDGWSGLNASWGKIKPGDVIFFCGKFFAEEEHNRIYIGASGDERNGYIYLKSCSINNGASVNDEWVVDWRSTLPNWSKAESWKRLKVNVYYIKVDTPYLPNRIFFYEKSGSRMEGQRVCSDGNIPPLKSKCEWYFDKTKKTLYVYATDNPATQFALIKTNNYLYQADGIMASMKSYIDISGLTAYGKGGYFTMRFTAVDHLKLHDITWYDSSSIANIEGSNTSPWKPSKYIEIYENYFDSRFKLDNSDARCMDSSVSSGIFLWNSVSYCSIYKNKIVNFMKSLGLLGAPVSDQWETGVEDVQIFENDISCPDLEYGYVVKAGGSTVELPAKGYLENISICKNYFHDFSVFIQIVGDNFQFYSNVIDNVFESSRKNKAAVSSGIAIGCGVRNKVYNNTIINVDEVGIQVGDFDDISSGCEIKNNILFNCGTDETPDFYEGVKGKYSIRIHDNNTGEVPSNITIMNNIIYNDKRHSASGEIYYKNLVLDVSSWNDKDLNNDVISGNKYINPKLRDKFTIGTDSPCNNAGVALADRYIFGIQKGSEWPNKVISIKQDDYGMWDVGAFVCDEIKSFNPPSNLRILTSH